MTTHTSNKKAMHGEDRISNLPDAILTHLLSFVSTREAVRTSTLSSRWKSVWPLVPTLDLSEMHFYMEIFKNDDNHRAKSQASFLNFLDRALLACTMPYIETITIRGQSLHESSHVKTWICAAIERNIRELVLIVDCESKKPLDELPQALFSNSKLVVLKLRLKMVVDFPETSVCFPNLKVLELHKVNYKDENSAQNLISSCPVLQDLVIGRGYSDNLRTLNVISHVLKNLKVTCREGFVKKLVIDAPALESIDFFDCVTQEYELVTDLPYISKAKLHVSNSFSVFRDEESFETCLTELLEKICNVKFLSFSSYTMVSLSHTESYDLPKFQNLTCFELYTRTKVKRISWDLMMEILDCSPILETLIFQGLEFSWDGKTRALHWDVPSCLLSSLKTIKIMGLHRAFDLRKITYFLENAKVLEKLIIDNGRWDEGFKLEIAEKLSKAHKASMACQFLLC